MDQGALGNSPVGSRFSICVIPDSFARIADTFDYLAQRGGLIGIDVAASKSRSIPDDLRTGMHKYIYIYP